MPRSTKENWLTSGLETSRRTLAVDEKLCAELVDVEANPLRELSLPGLSDVQKKRAKQLAFMLMMHTKNRAIQMISDHETMNSRSGDDFWKSGSW